MTLVSYKFNLTKPIEFETAVKGSGDAFGKSEVATKNAEEELKTLDKDSIRHKAYALQVALGRGIADKSLQEAEVKLTHTFAPGVYMRTAFVKAGAVIVGKIHKHQHGNILASGRATVVTEGGGTQHIEGFLPMVSEAGTKRVVYAHTDLVWTTIHLTNSTDLAEIEKELIAETYADYEQFLLEGDSMKQIEVSK